MIEVKTGRIAALLNKRRIRFTINPSEIADATITVEAAGVELAQTERTYVSAGLRLLRLRPTRAAIGDLRRRGAEAEARRLPRLWSSRLANRRRGNAATAAASGGCGCHS